MFSGCFGFPLFLGFHGTKIRIGRVLGYSTQFSNSRHIYYTNLYQIYLRSGPVSRTFEMRIQKFEAVDYNYLSKQRFETKLSISSIFVPGFCSKFV